MSKNLVADMHSAKHIEIKRNATLLPFHRISDMFFKIIARLISYRTKLYMESNLATWLRFVKFIKLTNFDL